MELKGFLFDKADSRDMILKLDASGLDNIPDFVDLSGRFTNVEDQESIGSCTAQAVIGLAEYLVNKNKKTFTDLSRLFLYKVTRNLQGLTGDTGASIRTCMHALRTLGTCPEVYYPYDITKFDDEPGPFQYALAQNYKSVQYYRLAGTNRKELLNGIRGVLSEATPVVFGVKVFDSYFKSNGNVYYPKTQATYSGWHAIVLVGYNDKKEMFKFRNSWGSNWGDEGYGWLSYDYILDSKSSDDFWILNDINYIDISTAL